MNKMNDLENKMKVASDYFRAVPPLDVWDKIEAQLEEEKKKPAPLLWLPAALLLLVLAGAIYYSWETTPPAAAPTPQQEIQTNPDKTQAAVTDDHTMQTVATGNLADQSNTTGITTPTVTAGESALAEADRNAANGQGQPDIVLSTTETTSTQKASSPELNKNITSNTRKAITYRSPKQKDNNIAAVKNTVDQHNISTEKSIASALQTEISIASIRDRKALGKTQITGDVQRNAIQHPDILSVKNTVPVAHAVTAGTELALDKELSVLHPVSVVSLKRTMVFQRKVLQPWRDPIVRCPTFSTRKPIRAFAEATTGAGYPIRKLAAKSDSFSYLERRKESETPIYHWDAGLGIGIVLKDRFVVRTGIDRLAVKEKFRYEKQGVIKVIITSYPDGTKDTTVTTGNELYAGNVTHKILSIPVEVGYQLRQNFWRIGLMAGVHLNLSYKSDGWLRMPDDDIAYRENQRGMFKDHLGLGLSAGVVVERLVGDHLGLFARPDFTYYLSDWSGGRNTISQKYFLPGIKIGMRAYL